MGRLQGSDGNWNGNSRGVGFLSRESSIKVHLSYGDLVCVP